MAGLNNNPFDPPHGILNNIGHDPSNAKINSDASSVYLARQAQKLARSSKILKKMGPYKAIVLRTSDWMQAKGTHSAEVAPQSWVDRAFGSSMAGQEGVSPKLFFVWARVPELHAALTPPTAVADNANSVDNFYIDQHDIFYATNETIEKCKAGDIIWVDYVNKNNMSDPIYLGPVAANELTNNPLTSTEQGAASNFKNGNCSSGMSGGTVSGDKAGGKWNKAMAINSSDFMKLSKNAKYIVWLYDYQVTNNWLITLRNYWTKPRIKKYLDFIASELYKEPNVKKYVTSLPSLGAGWKGKTPQQTLAQIVWGAMYRECRWNPIGILGHHPTAAWRFSNDTGYGMSQAPLFRYKRAEKLDKVASKYGFPGPNLFDKYDIKAQIDLIEPQKSLAFFVIEYIRFFRRYNKHGANHLMKISSEGAKNKYILGIWWAGGEQRKYMRKYGDIVKHGPTLYTSKNGGSMSSESADTIFKNAPKAGKNRRFTNSDFEKWSTSTVAVDIGTKTTPPSGIPKAKEGEPTQTPKPSIPSNTGCHGAGSADNEDHPERHRSPGGHSDVKKPAGKFKPIDGGTSKWSAGEEFRHYKRKAALNQIVIHESITSTVNGTVKVLRKRGLGVHFMIGRGGQVTQHVDINRATSHAKGNNYNSIGIEIVNPWYGKKANSKNKYKIIKYTQGKHLWATKTGYVVPTSAQMSKLYEVVKWCTSKTSIPLQIPGHINSDGFRWRRNGKAWAGQPGIIAHNWGFGYHGDGKFPAHYLWLRIHKKKSHQEAYKLTVSTLQWIYANTKSLPAKYITVKSGPGATTNVAQKSTTGKGA